jgi:hypothetical protein
MTSQTHNVPQDIVNDISKLAEEIVDAFGESSNAYYGDLLKVEALDHRVSIEIRAEDEDIEVFRVERHFKHFREGYRTEYICTAYRPGRWEKHLQWLHKEATEVLRQRRADEEEQRRIAFSPIDDSEWFPDE